MGILRLKWKQLVISMFPEEISYTTERYENKICPLCNIKIKKGEQIFVYISSASRYGSYYRAVHTDCVMKKHRSAIVQKQGEQK